MKPAAERRWRLVNPDDDQVRRFSAETKLDQFLCRLLLARGIDSPGAAKRFLSASLSEIHDPFTLKDMDIAVTRLARALYDNERVCVYGDYDVDGVTSVAALTDFLTTVGCDCFYHIPNRFDDGYGLHASAITEAAERGARLIITADCGITSCDEADLCSSLGIDLIVTDHHTPGPRIPAACAVINPLRDDCPFPFKSLAGVGVIFNLLLALRKRLRDNGFFETREEPNLREYLDLVALGTIADIVPLVDENRLFVNHGLRELSSSSRVGIAALKAVAGVAGQVDAGAVGFRLAPRINAAGRLDDATLGVELLLTSDPRRAAEISAVLNATNEDRQQLEKTILDDVLRRIGDEPSLHHRKTIVLASASWHSGVIGIVASRVVEIYHRPTILISLQDGEGKGSGRSIPGFHLYDALRACAGSLLRFGGHKYAAGLTIEGETLAEFVEHFDAVAQEALTADDLLPELRIDAELEPEEVTLAAAELVAALEPFGMGNSRPVFVLRGINPVQTTILKERHLKVRFQTRGYSFDAIGFGMAGSLPLADTIDLAFTLGINSWNGRRTLQLRIKDMK